MEQDVRIVEPNEPIFELQEIAGPDFALKQQGDVRRVAAEQSTGVTSHSAPRPKQGG